MGDSVLAAAGETDSQLPPSVGATLVENETAAYAGEGTVVNVTFCDTGVVEPSGAAGVQAVKLGITTGGGVPVATMVALVRLKTVAPLSKLRLTDPVTFVSGMADGTAVIM